MYINNRTLSWNLAHDIRAHGSRGKIAIVADNPLGLLSSTRKQWFELIRRLERERSGTLGTPRIAELTAQTVWMRDLKFTAKTPADFDADVVFATADDFVRLNSVYRFIYITHDLEHKKMNMLTAWMPRAAVMVVYGQD